MPTVFEKTTLNRLILANRLVRSATWEGMCAPDGRPTKRLCGYMQTLAEGGVGLLISGYAYVRPEGKQNKGKMGIYTDAFAEDFVQLTRAVHGAGGKIIAQLVHAGGQTDSKTAGRQPLAPSAVQTAQYGEMPAEMSVAEIGAVVAAFASAARRAKAWGFDGVQLHGAHGYLINQFLSPLTNRRTDDYGGDITRRVRFALAVYQAVRDEVGASYPVMVKLNAADHLNGGLQVDDALYVARQLDAAGIDAIEVSSGTAASGHNGPARVRIKHPDKEAYNLDLARRVKSVVNCSVAVVGGFRSFGVVEKAIRESGMDFVAMSRPLIREPDLPNRWQGGDLRPAACISCNGCFKPGRDEGGIYCVQDNKQNAL